MGKRFLMNSLKGPGLFAECLAAALLAAVLFTGCELFNELFGGSGEVEYSVQVVNGPTIFSNAEYDLGSFEAGSGTDITIRFSNTGDEDIELGSVTFNNLDGEAFSRSFSFNDQIRSGEQTDMGISFTPTEAFLYRASVLIQIEGEDEFIVKLRGTGTVTFTGEPDIELRDAGGNTLTNGGGGSTIYMGQYNTGDTAATVFLTVKNIGTAPLTISEITCNPAGYLIFSLDSYLLDPDAAATLSVRADTSMGSGVPEAILYINSDDPTDYVFSHPFYWIIN